MMPMLLAFVLALSTLAFAPVSPGDASIGVGLGCGFTFDLGALSKGQTHAIGQMCILNTGDEPGWYKMNVGYLYQQRELQVPKEWVRFDPETFYLEPCTKLEGGYSCPFDVAQKIVQAYLDIPKNARFDDYFAYLEGCTDSDGVVGVCVGAPLRFTIPHGRGVGNGH